MIIGSVTPPPSTGWIFNTPSQDVVPQIPANLSEDLKIPKGLGLPPEKWNNLNVLLARYNKTKYYDVFSVQVSRPGMELSRSYILEQIEFLLINSAKKTRGKT